jgi:hypothetical protein
MAGVQWSKGVSPPSGSSVPAYSEPSAQTSSQPTTTGQKYDVKPIDYSQQQYGVSQEQFYSEVPVTYKSVEGGVVSSTGKFIPSGEYLPPSEKVPIPKDTQILAPYLAPRGSIFIQNPNPEEGGYALNIKENKPIEFTQIYRNEGVPVLLVSKGVASLISEQPNIEPKTASLSIGSPSKTNIPYSGWSVYTAPGEEVLKLSPGVLGILAKENAPKTDNKIYGVDEKVLGIFDVSGLNKWTREHFTEKTIYNPLTNKTEYLVGETGYLEDLRKGTNLESYQTSKRLADLWAKPSLSIGEKLQYQGLIWKRNVLEVGNINIKLEEAARKTIRTQPITIGGNIAAIAIASEILAGSEFAALSASAKSEKLQKIIVPAIETGNVILKGVQYAWMGSVGFRIVTSPTPVETAGGITVSEVIPFTIGAKIGQTMLNAPMFKSNGYDFRLGSRTQFELELQKLPMDVQKTVRFDIAEAKKIPMQIPEQKGHLFKSKFGKDFETQINFEHYIATKGITVGGSSTTPHIRKSVDIDLFTQESPKVEAEMLKSYFSKLGKKVEILNEEKSTNIVDKYVDMFASRSPMESAEVMLQGTKIQLHTAEWRNAFAYTTSTQKGTVYTINTNPKGYPMISLKEQSMRKITGSFLDTRANKDLPDLKKIIRYNYKSEIAESLKYKGIEILPKTKLPSTAEELRQVRFQIETARYNLVKSKVENWNKFLKEEKANVPTELRVGVGKSAERMEFKLTEVKQSNAKMSEVIKSILPEKQMKVSDLLTKPKMYEGYVKGYIPYTPYSNLASDYNYKPQQYYPYKPYDYKPYSYESYTNYQKIPYSYYYKPQQYYPYKSNYNYKPYKYEYYPYSNYPYNYYEAKKIETLKPIVPFTPSFMFPLDLGKKGKYKGKRKTQYTPDVLAVILGIKGKPKMIKGAYTGLEIRGMVTKKPNTKPSKDVRRLMSRNKKFTRGLFR